MLAVAAQLVPESRTLHVARHLEAIPRVLVIPAGAPIAAAFLVRGFPVSCRFPLLAILPLWSRTVRSAVLEFRAVAPLSAFTAMRLRRTESAVALITRRPVPPLRFRAAIALLVRRFVAPLGLRPAFTAMRLRRTESAVALITRRPVPPLRFRPAIALLVRRFVAPL